MRNLINPHVFTSPSPMRLNPVLPLLLLHSSSWAKNPKRNQHRRLPPALIFVTPDLVRLRLWWFLNRWIMLLILPLLLYHKRALQRIKWAKRRSLFTRVDLQLLKLIPSLQVLLQFPFLHYWARTDSSNKISPSWNPCSNVCDLCST